ncbi:enoyl-CoA hydratase-related protein [Amycolatopsis echigonensis]|uniref:2-(1,2-epoxy-1,2-dihydrophenyl)acetyl-CoA isomerase n=1 Tax=Amycolatopsis echigonensis TaxID=2576905 RepID=A0A2N3WPI7_9PSEU|nr:MULTISPECIES: enoyl-CoA hydratase-related protein [Amycolatopsis]MBB2502045.1 enoyl-CoA hydratase/isomerase family protein [Amycolatopsis echigonensis]PKV95789.1 2-(1,2-epoxy-1,2-dihydrophenyl)acetyl-CoA isomerase [Amycolatopsis niigatensis]
MSLVSYTCRDGAAWIRLTDSSRGNPLSQAIVDELATAVRQARHDDARVVVLAAEGRAFSVGGDVSAFASADDVEQAIDDLAEALHRTISELHRMDAVVVSVVHGAAAGAGLALAAAADLVLAGASARFTLAYTKLGFTPDGGTSLLTASLGLHRALHLALLNPVLTAEQAHAFGLVAQVHPDDELAAAAEQVVRQLAAGSRAAQVATKRLLREAAAPAAETLLRRETLSIRARAASPDGREGVAAFAEKRTPEFPSN